MKQTLKRGVKKLGKRVRSDSPPLEPVFFVDHGSIAILDTGASKSVIGKRRLEQLIISLPQEFARKISWQKSETIFRFGNNGTLSSLGAVFMPFGKGWLKIEVVDGTTPFLLSNAFLKAVSADICTSKRLLCMFHGKVSVPLTVSSKGLFLVDLLLILKHANQLERNEGNWEVVTNLTDETQPRELSDRQHTETNMALTADIPQSHNPPAATRVSSKREQFPASSNHDGAQEGDHRLHLRRDHGCAPGIPGGCHAGNDSIEQRRHHCQTTGSDDPEAMGRTDHGRRKTCRKDLCRDSGHRCELCRIHEKEERLHLSMGSELPQLCTGCREDEQAGTDGSSPTGVDSPDDQEDKGRVESTGSHYDRLGCDRRAEGSSWLGSSTGNHIFGKWTHDGKENDTHQRRPQEDAGGHGEGDPRPCESNSDSDRDLAARADILDASRRFMNNSIEKSSYDDDQVSTEVHNSRDTPISKFYAQELSNLVEKFELQLEELAHHSADIRTRHSAPRFPKSKERLDILEIYCFPDSQLTQTARQLGLKARRFTLQDGDLRTPEGQERLWQIIETQRPRHIWASPDCKLWGNFARRNMGRSKQLRTRILDGRKHERPNLPLCEEVYLYQVEHGRHFHLEQPVGSELLLQPELEQTRYGTLPTIFDMCEVGKLNWKGEPLQKRTIVLTTSRTLHGALDCRYFCKTHEHRQIAGQVKHSGEWISLSSFAAKYTAGFARTVVRALQRVSTEAPLLQEELKISTRGETIDAVLVGEALKRRRLISKQTVRELGNEEDDRDDQSKQHVQGRLKDLFGELEGLAPRVGSIVIDPKNTTFQRAQGFCSFKMVHAEVCRGTERLRIPKVGTPLKDLEVRKTYSLSRSSGTIEQVGDEEEWQRLTQRQRIRKRIPSRLTLTMFGTRNMSTTASSSTSSKSVLDEDEDMQSGREKRKTETEPDMKPKRMKGLLEDQEELVQPSKEDQSVLEKEEIEPEIVGRPPRNLARHGPAFLVLKDDQQKWLKLVHHRLGLPDPDTLTRYLRSTNAEPELVEGARDFQCDACSESRKGFDLPQAGAIHENLGFNDTVGMDGSHFSFAHLIDQGTLFHVARPCGGDSNSQWAFLEEYWFRAPAKGSS